MKKVEKAEAMDRTTSNINRAKEELYRAVRILEEEGLEKDAEQLYRMIIRIEKFQNKYNQFSIYNLG